MIMGKFKCFLILSLQVFYCCNTFGANGQQEIENSSFTAFTERFMDAYMQNNPVRAIFEAYPKYNDHLKVPDKAAFQSDVKWCKRYLDTLSRFSYDELSPAHKMQYKILQNELQRNIWQIDTLQDQTWDPSAYNIGWAGYELLTAPYRPLDERLYLLSGYLANASPYYEAAYNILHEPTKEHTAIAIQQNQGSIEIFTLMVPDSVAISSLSQSEKDTLLNRSARAAKAIELYTGKLQKMLDDPKTVFRSYRIGPALFEQKFKYEIVSDFTAKQIFDKAQQARTDYYKEMYSLATGLWPKYFDTSEMPADSLLRIQSVISEIAKQHAAPADAFDTIQQQLQNLTQFISRKDLFNFHSGSSVVLRKMPAYAMGVTIAYANFPPAYQRNGFAYYTISDLSEVPAEKAESMLREYNNYTLQFLTIHEGIPGHCMQGIYNSSMTTDKISAVFGNGTMIEGWANYIIPMLLENGWGNDSPEIQLMYYKWALRECCNAIIDYGIHCLNYSEADVRDLLVNKAFQEEAQVQEKYNRAQLSQVQLCSYFTGNTEIWLLRQEYQKQKGDAFSLKQFHEEFLSYGSAPVKYIREMMLK